MGPFSLGQSAGTWLGNRRVVGTNPDRTKYIYIVMAVTKDCGKDTIKKVIYYYELG